MRGWADQHPDVAARFAGAIYQTGAWANRNHGASAPILAKYSKLPLASIARMYRGTFAESTNVALAQPVVEAGATYRLVGKTFRAAELFYRMT